MSHNPRETPQRKGEQSQNPHSRQQPQQQSTQQRQPQQQQSPQQGQANRQPTQQQNQPPQRQGQVQQSATQSHPPQGLQQQTRTSQPSSATQQQSPQGQSPQHGSQPQSQPTQTQARPTQRQPQPSQHASQQVPASGRTQTGVTAQQGQVQQMGQQPEGGDQQQVDQSHLESETINDIVQGDVVTAEPDSPLQTLAAQMHSEDVAAIIIESDGEPEGIITDRKLALTIEDQPDLTEMTAADVVGDEFTTGSDEMTVFEALQQLSEEDISRLPIVDDEGELVGIITLDDIIVLLSKELQDASEIIQSQSDRL